jgi:hypothetical protein
MEGLTKDWIVTPKTAKGLRDIGFTEGYGSQVSEDLDKDGGVFRGLVQEFSEAVSRVHSLHVRIILNAKGEAVEGALRVRKTVKVLSPFLYV